MPITPAIPVGLTPKVAKIHWDDILHQFRLKITFQLTTPFGTLPEVEQVFDLGDLTGVLDMIKNVWAIVTTAEQDMGYYITAPAGTFAGLADIPVNKAVRNFVGPDMPDPYTPTETGPDTIPAYDGTADNWGQTGP